MKRLVLLFLTTLLCLCMFACSGKNNEVELTTENYETYLNVFHDVYFSGKNWLIKPLDSANSISCNSEAQCIVTVNGASTNYDYNNVVLTVKMTATYNTYYGFEKTQDVTTQKEVKVSCDIGGSGMDKAVFFEGIEETYQIQKDSLKLTWEVVSVSGTVTRIS